MLIIYRLPASTAPGPILPSPSSILPSRPLKGSEAAPSLELDIPDRKVSAKETLQAFQETAQKARMAQKAGAEERRVQLEKELEEEARALDENLEAEEDDLRLWVEMEDPPSSHCMACR